MKAELILKVSEEAITQEVRGETVILDLATEEYFSLDEVGTRVWQLIQPSASFGSLKTQLLTEFDVDAETLDADLNELVEVLIREGLVTCETAGG